MKCEKCKHRMVMMDLPTGETEWVCLDCDIVVEDDTPREIVVEELGEIVEE